MSEFLIQARLFFNHFSSASSYTFTSEKGIMDPLVAGFKTSENRIDWVCAHLEECLESVELKKSILTAISEQPDPLQALNTFLENLLNEVKAENLESMLKLVQELLPTSQDEIDRLVQIKTAGQRSAIAPADQYQAFEPLVDRNSKHAIVKKVFTQWKRDWPLLIKSVVNLINLFIDTLNFLNINKNSMSLWDRQLIMLIISKFLLIPSLLAHMISPFIGSILKSYVVAYGIIALLSLTIYVYQRWIRRPIENISHAENIKEVYQRGELKHHVVQRSDMKKLGLALQTQNVFIIGPSGSGKTSFVQSLVQVAVEEGKLKNKSAQRVLSPEVRKRQIHWVNCRAIMNGKSYNKAENFELLKTEISGHEQETLLIFDEVQSLTHDPSCFDALKPILDSKGLRCIAMTTPEGHEKIKKDYDKDLAFTDRWCEIRMNPNEDEIEAILLDAYHKRVKEIFNETGIHILIENEAIQELIRKAKETFSDAFQTRKALACLDDLINRIQMVYSPDYFLPELEKLYSERELKKERFKVYGEVNHLAESSKDPAPLLEELEKRKKVAQLIQQNKNRELKCKTECFKLCKNPAFEKRVDLQKLYLLNHYYAIPALRKRRDDEIKKWQGKIDLRLDSSTIERYFQEKEKVTDKSVETKIWSITP